MEGDLSNTDQHGVIPRAAAAIFEELKQPQYSQDDTDVQCSYLEIYNENIIDLLNPSSGKLNLREDIKKGVYVERLTKKVTYNTMDCLESLNMGAYNRGCRPLRNISRNK